MNDKTLADKVRQNYAFHHTQDGSFKNIDYYSCKGCLPSVEYISKEKLDMHYIKNHSSVEEKKFWYHRQSEKIKNMRGK